MYHNRHELFLIEPIPHTAYNGPLHLLLITIALYTTHSLNLAMSLPTQFLNFITCVFKLFFCFCCYLDTPDFLCSIQSCFLCYVFIISMVMSSAREFDRHRRLLPFLDVTFIFQNKLIVVGSIHSYNSIV